MMDSEIKKQNKIPGSCDGFTRPEEISALSKFLRDIKDATDARTSLIEDNLGFKNAELKDIEELPDSLEVLDKHSNDVSKLVSEKEWIDSGKELRALEKNKTEKLKHEDNINLGTERENLENRENKIKDLPEDVEKINDKTKITSLGQEKEKISSSPEIKALEKNKETIFRSSRESASNKDYTAIDKVESLGNNNDKLKVNDSLRSLDKDREDLKDDRDIRIKKERENLEGIIKENKLSDNLLKLKAKENVDLEKDKETIKGSDKKISLENDAETIPGEEKKVGLEKERVDISHKDSTKLSREIEKIKPLKDKSLDNHLETIKEKPIDELEDDLIKIKGKSNPELSKDVEKIKDKEISDLGKYVDSIEDKETISLSDSIEKIKPKTDNTLDNYVEKLGIKEKNSLSDTLLKVGKVQEIEHLGETSEKISPNKDINLGTHRDNLKVNQDESLGTERKNLDINLDDLALGTEVSRIDIEESKNILSNQLSRILGITPEIKLGEDVEKLDKEDIQKLDTLSKISEKLSFETTSINLSGKLETIEKSESEEIEHLPENRETIGGEGVTENIKELSNILERPEETNVEIYNLSNHRENIEAINEIVLGNHRENIEKIKEVDLGTARINIEDVQEVELGTTRINIENSEDVELSNHREDIENPKEDTLGTTRVNLDNTSDVDLGTTRINLENTGHDEESLGTTRINIDNVSDVDLGTTRVNIENTSDVELGTTRINIESSEDVDLSNHRLDIEDSQDEELSNHRENLDDSRENTLSDHRENIESPEDVSLSDYRENLEDTREDTLSDTRINIDNVSDKELSTYRENIEIPENDTLSDTRLDIEDSQDEELSNHRENLDDSRENTLSDYKENIESPEDVSLSDFLDSIEDEDDEALSTTRIDTPSNDTTKINQGTSWELDGKGGIVEVAKGNHKGFQDKIYGKGDKINIEDAQDEELSDTLIENPDSKNEGSWNDETSENLYDTVLGTPDNDTTKLNLGMNFKKDSRRWKRKNGKVIWILRGDDYFHKNHNFNTYEELTEHSNTAALLNNEEEHKDYIDDLNEEDGKELMNVIKKVLPNDTTKLNYGLNGKRDSDWGGEAKGDDSYHKDFDLTKEDLENQNNKYSAPGDKNKNNDWLDNLNESDRNALTNAIKSRSKDVDQYYDYVLKFADSKNLKGNGWAAKVRTLMSTYLSGDMNASKMDEFLEALYNTYINGNVVKEMIAVSKGEKTIETAWDEVGLYRTPNSKLPLNPLSTAVANPTTYIRWVAEQTGNLITNDSWHKGPISGLRSGARALMIDATLWALIMARRIMEVSLKANRDRLPGADTGLLQNIVQGSNESLIETGAGMVVDTVQNAINATKEIDTSKPMNRPERKNEWGVGGNMGSIAGAICGSPETQLKEEEGWETVNSRSTQSLFSPIAPDAKEKGFKSVLKNLGKGFIQSIVGKHGEKNYKFHDQYIQGKGIFTTLTELTNVGTSEIKSVEDLRDALLDSPFIATPRKFSSTKNSKGVYTLDSNAFWEIILEPFVGDINGNRSYLPSIHEINIINAFQHGVNTEYNRWIPVAGFELSKSRLNTKNLNLYDGEISYPISMEFTNELRLTLVDDQYKSWRRYFEKCAEVAVYNSYPHEPKFYGWDDNMQNWKGYPTNIDEKTLTIVDKNYSVTASYKNLAFRCRIYSMTPQFSTINKYDLLVVLKDMSEERSGDIEPSATDLSLTFSIVGENPQPFTNAEIQKWQKQNIVSWNIGLAITQNIKVSKSGVSSIFSSSTKAGNNKIIQS